MINMKNREKFSYITIFVSVNPNKIKLKQMKIHIYFLHIKIEPFLKNYHTASIINAKYNRAEFSFKLKFLY